MIYKLLLILFVICGCSTKSNYLLNNIDKDFPNTALVDSNPKLLLENLDLSPSGGFIVHDNLLYVHNLFSGGSRHSFSCYDLESGAWKQNFLTIGRGSGEILFIKDFFVNDYRELQLTDNNSIWLIKFCDILNNKNPLFDYSIDTPKDRWVTKYTMLDDDFFIAANCDSLRYTIRRGDKLTYFGDFDYRLFGDKAKEELRDVYRITLGEMRFCYNKKLNKIAAANCFKMMLDLINPSDGSISASKCYGAFSPEGLAGENDVLIGIEATDDVIVAAYRHINSKNITVLYFDWDLKPLKRMVIGFDTYFSYLTPDCKSIYFLSLENSLYRYDL